MIISKQDRENYTKLCALHMALVDSLGKCKHTVNEDQVYTVLYQAAKRLVGRKDMLWMDHDGSIRPATEATIKLSFAGFLKRDRWGKHWARVREYDMWNYIFRESFITGLKGHPTKRNPAAMQDLCNILDDGLKLKGLKDQGLDVSTKLFLPHALDVQEGLGSDELRLSNVKGFQVKAFELVSTAGWTCSIHLRCIAPNGTVYQIDDLVRQETFIRFSEQCLLDPIFTMLKDAKKYVDEQYEKKMEPQREFNQKYGQYLVAKEL